MKVLLAEYSVFHDPVLAPEGEAMLRVLEDSFTRCGYEVVSPEGGDFAEELRRLAPECDYGLVIAPDALLGRYTHILESLTHNIGCASLNCALCANKIQAGRILAAHDIAVPPETASGMRVIKEVSGAGTVNMRLGDEEPGVGEFGQEFIDGEHLSVSLVGSRYVGEACLYYSGAAPLPLSLNAQQISIEDGVFSFSGGTVNVDHPARDEIIATAVKAATVLGCQGYAGVDVVVADRVYVVDVNSRPTSSLVGITAIMDEEIGELLINASKGILPGEVHLAGTARYDKSGQVVIL